MFFLAISRIFDGSHQPASFVLVRPGTAPESSESKPAERLIDYRRWFPSAGVVRPGSSWNGSRIVGEQAGGTTD